MPVLEMLICCYAFSELPNTTSGCLLTLERLGGEGGQRDPPIGFSNLKIEALKQ